jgi:hypothetical protein
VTPTRPQATCHPRHLRPLQAAPLFSKSTILFISFKLRKRENLAVTPRSSRRCASYTVAVVGVDDVVLNRSQPLAHSFRCQRHTGSTNKPTLRVIRDFSCLCHRRTIVGVGISHLTEMSSYNQLPEIYNHPALIRRKHKHNTTALYCATGSNMARI